MAGRGDIGPGFGPMMDASGDDSREAFRRLGYSKETIVLRMHEMPARVGLFYKLV